MDLNRCYGSFSIGGPNLLLADLRFVLKNDHLYLPGNTFIICIPKRVRFYMFNPALSHDSQLIKSLYFSSIKQFFTTFSIDFYTATCIYYDCAGKIPLKVPWRHSGEWLAEFCLGFSHFI